MNVTACYNNVGDIMLTMEEEAGNGLGLLKRTIMKYHKSIMNHTKGQGKSGLVGI